MVEFRINSLSSSHLLNEELSLADAAAQIAKTRHPVYAVPRSAGPTAGDRAATAEDLRVLLPDTVRFACQDRFAAGLRIKDLVAETSAGRLAESSGLVFDSQASAERRLREDVGISAAIVKSSDGDLAIWRETPKVDTAILMAGGLGQRLRPLTDDLPKPLLEVGGVPLLLRTIELVRRHGVTKVYVSVNYLAGKVKAAIGDGSQLGVEVEYLEESEPLDTGAGLALLNQVGGPFFVLNGDILTNFDLSAMARQHHLAQNLATIATYLFPAPLPYGVMHRDGDRITEIEEKPVFRYPINAGMYLFDARALEFVEHGKALAMVEYLNRLATQGERVGRFALVEYWNDVGSHEDFERAQVDAGRL